MVLTDAHSPDAARSDHRRRRLRIAAFVSLALALLIMHGLAFADSLRYYNHDENMYVSAAVSIQPGLTWLTRIR